MRAAVALAFTALVLLLGFAAAPVAVAGDPCYHGFDIPPRTEGAETQIKVAPCAFAPTVTHVAVGSTVRFFNGPDFTHLITGANAEWGSRDVEVKPGQEVSFTFNKAGIYPYACALHRGMSGTIVVGSSMALAPAGPAEPAAPAANTTTSASNGAAAPAAAASGLGYGHLAAAGVAGAALGGLAALGLMRYRRGSRVAAEPRPDPGLELHP